MIFFKELSFLERKFFGIKAAHLLLTAIALNSLFIIITFTVQLKNYQTPLSLSEKDARSYAADVMEKLEQEEKPWTILAQATTCSNEQIQGDRYLWQEEGSDRYKNLIGSYAADTCWQIRYALFEGKPEQRAQEYILFIHNNGEVFRIQHHFADNKPGALLPKAVARGIALEMIENLYGLTTADLKEIGVDESEKKARKDYIFTFQDLRIKLKNQDSTAAITVEIKGDQICDYYRSVIPPVPEWVELEKWRVDSLKTKTLLLYIIFGVSILWIFSIILYLSSFAFSVRSFFTWFVPLFCLTTLHFFNKLRAHTFSFSPIVPFGTQWNYLVMEELLIAAFFSFLVALLICPRDKKNSVDSISVDKNLYWKTLIRGSIFGLLTSAVIITTHHFSDIYHPLYADLRILSFYSALFGMTADTIVFAFLLALIGIAVTNYIQITKKALQLVGSLSALYIGLSGLLIVVFDIESIASTLIAGIVGTVVLSVFLLLFPIHSPLASIPAATIIALTFALKKIHLRSLSTPQSHMLIVLVILFTTAFWWFTQLYKKEELSRPKHS